MIARLEIDVPSVQTPATDLHRGTRHTTPATTLAVLLTATFMGTFDFFVVNVSAPSIRQDLHASQAQLELVVGGYAFAYASALVLGGRLGDLYGHRRLFVSGMLGFTFTSALCGLAQTPGQLIVARLAQGLTAALVLPQVLAVISATADATSRARAMAWYGVAAGVGSISGQVLGGLLVTADVAGLGWRLIFLVNLPVGLIGAALGQRMLHAQTGRPAGREAQDPLGAAGLAGGLALLLVPLTVGRTAGWPWWTWASMAGSLPILAVTMLWQRVLHSRGGQPLVELSLLRAGSFRTGLLANFAFMASFGSYMFTLALLLQSGLGLDAFEAGLVFAPAGLAFSASALVAPRFVARYGPYVLVWASALTAAGLASLGLLAEHGGSHTSIGGIVVLAALTSLGNGIVLPSLIGAALRDVPARHSGAAAGTLTTAQQFASATGVAAIGTLFFAGSASGDGAGMAWSATADALLVAIVAAMVVLGARERREHA